MGRLLLAMLGLLVSVQVPAQQGAMRQEVSLGRLPEKWTEAPKSDPSGRHLAGIEELDGGVRVWFDGKPGPVYTAIAKDHPVLSDEGGRYAYDGCTGDWQGGRHYAVVDGAPGPDFDALAGPSFAVGGERVWYLGWRGGKVVCAVDGIAGDEYDEVQEPIFSADGLHVAYAARIGDKWVAVGDGMPGPQCDEVRGVVFLEALGSLSYCARQGAQWRMVIGSVAHPPFDDIGTDAPVVSPEGTVYYTAQQAGKWLLVANGAEIARYDAFGHTPFVEPGGRLCYTARRGDKWLAVAGGFTTPELDEVSCSIVAPTGKVVYSGREGGKCLVAVGDTIGGGYDEVHYSSPTIGATGSVAFIVRKGEEWFVWRDGAESGPYQDFAYYEKSFAIDFSDDGAHLAYAVKRNDKWVVVTDGSESPAYDDIWVPVPLFTPGAVAPTYQCAIGGKTHLVLQGQAQPEYDDIWVSVRWTEEAQSQILGYVAKRDGKSALVVRGQEWGWYDEVRDVEASADGTRVACAAKRGDKWLAVVDGREWPECDELAQGPQFAPGGAGAVCLAKYGERAAVIRDGQQGPLHDLVYGPYSFPLSSGYSPDGRRFAYIARDAKKDRMIVDGVPGPEFDDIVGEGPPRYGEDGALKYLAIRGRELCRVTVPALP